MALIPAIIILVTMLIATKIPVAESCYGPHITADIDETQVIINQTVTVAGRICPVDKAYRLE